MKRTAHCSCGQLRAECEGEPAIVSLCNCTHCQRRTGAPFGLGAWYRKEQVALAGETKSFTRYVETRGVTNRFCPTCGGVLAWELSEGRPGMIAIAVGMFADPQFPPPERSIYEAHKHPWFDITVELGERWDE